MTISKLIRRLTRERSGQSLLEVALMLPFLVLLLGYAVDFGYFFLVAANLTSAARNATEYSIQGYESAGQGKLPSAGPITSTASVSAEALGDMATLANASTVTSVAVCSEANGMSGNLRICTSYGPAATAYSPATDPEASRFTLQRVDVTYTVQPPIALNIFNVSLLGSLQFHRQVSMRAME